MVAISHPERSAEARKWVAYWLFAVALLVASMVTLGGLTRLTGSGLSITEWQPVMGIIPPLSHETWLAEFAKYQQIPQYWRENRGMSLAAFQSIYWWEWTHRFLGRLIGAAFLLPFIFFAATGAIVRSQWPRMMLLFALGALQGFVGWWMVESGLETRVSVSQYRLVIHLGVAILLFGALLWMALEFLRDDPSSHAISSVRVRNRFFGWTLVAFVYIQMLLGALVAGLHAGLLYNTWPSMNGRFIPENAFVLHPPWRNFFENPGLAQFDHRVVAYLVAAAVIVFWFVRRRGDLPGTPRTSTSALLALIFLQIALGIATLLNQAPLALAALHQATAVALFAAAIWNVFELSAMPYFPLIPFAPAPGQDRR
jgi:cytochrome c oxidase assembly protein subunit 15